jgi:sec-independent protein translocase protein TatA
MFQGLTGWHFLIILVVILLLFGAAKLPALAKSVGQSARVFKGEMKEMKKDEGADAASSASPAAPAGAPAPVVAHASEEPPSRAPGDTIA